MNRKLKDFMTIFLVQLVVSLPLYTTSAYATISRITVKGNDNIEGFARSNDFLNFIVQASTGNQTIAREQLRLGSAILFDACKQLPNDVHECTLKFPGTGKQDFEAKAIPFTINLFKDKAAAQIDDSKTGNVLIDNKAPEVKLSLAKNRFSAKDSIALNYEANDFACNDASCSNRCVGLKNLELSSPAGFKENIDLSDTAGCTKKDTLDIDVKKFKDGPNQISARAFDKFGLASQNTSVQFTVDTKGPQILASTFKIFRRGTILRTFSPQSVPVEASIDISADDLEPNSVTADFTSLNPSQGLENVKAACTLVKSGLYRCKWAIDLNPTSKTGAFEELTDFQDSSEPKNSAKANAMAVTVNATDLSGNSEGTAISANLALDDQGPVVQSLTTGIEKGGKIFAKAGGNTVTAVLSDATGISPDEVVLHVGDTRLQPKSCRKDSNFVCRWEGLTFAAPKTVISIKSDTVDFLLNPVKEEKTLEVLVDDTAPVLKGISFTPVGSLSDALPGIFKLEDKIAVEANVTEENELTALGNFSRFISKAAKVPGNCKRLQANDYTCVWLTDSIDTAGTGFIEFNFSDTVGNSLIVKKPDQQLTVLELETSKLPDFWKNVNTCLPKGEGIFALSPGKIDRQVGTLTNQRAYCSVKLEPKASRQTSIILMSDAECKGDGLKLVQKIETLNKEVGSTSPIIKVTLKKDELKVDEINISCVFGIISRVDNRITKNPELEEVNISIELYNFPLGEFSKSVQDNIDKAKKDAKEYLKFVGNLNTIVEFSKKSCQAINTVVTAWSVVDTIAVALKNLESGLPVFKPAATGTCLGGEAGSNSAERFKGKTDKFCDWVTCKRGLFGRYDNKVGKDGKIGGANLLEKWTEVLGPGDYYGQEIVTDNLRKIDYGRYMDPQNSLFVALIPPTCLPGVISGLEKLRQIKCLYADCLQNAVAKDGIPPSACDDLKAHTTCKYIAGEVFAVIPWTAFVDHWTRLAKNLVSNPFSFIGLVPAVYCEKFCHAQDAGIGFKTCRVIRMFSMLGDTFENVKSMIDQGSFFKVRQDYCSRLEDEKGEQAASQNAQSSQTGQQAQPRTQSQQQNQNPSQGKG